LRASLFLVVKTDVTTCFETLRLNQMVSQCIKARIIPRLKGQSDKKILLTLQNPKCKEKEAAKKRKTRTGTGGNSATGSVTDKNPPLNRHHAG